VPRKTGWTYTTFYVSGEDRKRLKAWAARRGIREAEAVRILLSEHLPDRGAPIGGAGVPLKVRLERERLQRLRAHCSALGLPASAVIRRLIRERIRE